MLSSACSFGVARGEGGQGQRQSGGRVAGEMCRGGQGRVGARGHRRRGAAEGADSLVFLGFMKL